LNAATLSTAGRGVGGGKRCIETNKGDVLQEKAVSGSYVTVGTRAWYCMDISDSSEVGYLM